MGDSFGPNGLSIGSNLFHPHLLASEDLAHIDLAALVAD
jgi:hypothetical protein